MVQITLVTFCCCCFNVLFNVCYLKLILHHWPTTLATSNLIAEMMFPERLGVLVGIISEQSRNSWGWLKGIILLVTRVHLDGDSPSITYHLFFENEQILQSGRVQTTDTTILKIYSFLSQWTTTNYKIDNMDIVKTNYTLRRVKNRHRISINLMPPTLIIW